jgi:hypothetical protein
MIDSLFSAVFAFCLLVGGTLAIASAAFGDQPAQAAVAQRLQPLAVASAAAARDPEPATTVARAAGPAHD